MKPATAKTTTVKRANPASAHRARPQARYDIVDHQYNVRGGKKRRLPRIETQPEDQILSDVQRLQVLNLTRDMMRNNPQARGTAKTMRVNVIGDFGKLQFKTRDEWLRKVQSWFNNVWAKKADFIDGSTFRECLQLIVYALANEGDFVVVFDNGLISGKPNGTGKLLFFEADQIVSLSASDFAEFEARGYSQQSGIILDRFGRHCGAIVTGQHGATVVGKNEALILTHDPDDDTPPPWLHVRRKFRLRQGRGVPDSATSLESIIDGHEMLDYELQSGKRAAAQYAAVMEPANTPLDGINSGAGFGDESAASGEGEGTEDGADDEEDDEEFRAPALEEVFGGKVDYYPDGSKIEYPPVDRPNVNLAPFLDYVSDIAGLPHGLAHAYTRGRADTSYTAFRGDMVMTWMAFRDFQQFLEDNFSDWLAIIVISWGILVGAIEPPPAEIADTWQAKITWQYPRMPAVDEQKEIAANAQKLKTGLTTFADLLGPECYDKFDELAEEVKYAREKGLPLSIFESVSGQKEENNTSEEAKQNG